MINYYNSKLFHNTNFILSEAKASVISTLRTQRLVSKPMLHSFLNQLVNRKNIYKFGESWKMLHEWNVSETLQVKILSKDILP